MKTGRVFWGVFFVFTGALLLLVKFDVLTIHAFHLWRFWPVILVLWGAAVLVGPKKVKLLLVVLMAIALGLLVIAALTPPWLSEEDHGLVEERQQEFVQPYNPASSRASFTFSSGAGTFTVRDTTTDLMAATTYTNYGSYSVESESEEGVEHVRLTLSDRHVPWRFGNVRNRAEVRLNSAPLWDLRFEVGAASMDIDLSRHDVDNVTIDAGAADVRVKLGDRSKETHLRIECGASSVNILVPESLGCSIHVEAPLSSKSFRSFVKSASGEYRTENFDSAPGKIWIDVSAGVSSITAARY